MPTNAGQRPATNTSGCVTPESLQLKQFLSRQTDLKYIDVMPNLNLDAASTTSLTYTRPNTAVLALTLWMGWIITASINGGTTLLLCFLYILKRGLYSRFVLLLNKLDRLPRMGKNKSVVHSIDASVLLSSVLSLLRWCIIIYFVVFSVIDFVCAGQVQSLELLPRSQLNLAFAQNWTLEFSDYSGELLKNISMKVVDQWRLQAEERHGHNIPSVWEARGVYTAPDGWWPNGTRLVSVLLDSSTMPRGGFHWSLRSSPKLFYPDGTADGDKLEGYVAGMPYGGMLDFSKFNFQERAITGYVVYGANGSSTTGNANLLCPKSIKATVVGTGTHTYVEEDPLFQTARANFSSLQFSLSGFDIHNYPKGVCSSTFVFDILLQRENFVLKRSIARSKQLFLVVSALLSGIMSINRSFTLICSFGVSIIRRCCSKRFDVELTEIELTATEQDSTSASSSKLGRLALVEADWSLQQRIEKDE